MNLLQIINFEELGVKITVIAALVAISDFVLKKFGAKIPKFIVNYLPVLIAIAGSFIAELIQNRKFDFSKEMLYGGLMAYSLGTILSVAVRKLIRGESTESALNMLVQGIAENICVNNAGAELTEIVRILTNIANTDRASAKSDITALLKKAAKEDVSDAEIMAAAEMILLSAQNLIKEK